MGVSVRMPAVVSLPTYRVLWVAFVCQPAMLLGAESNGNACDSAVSVFLWPAFSSPSTTSGFGGRAYEALDWSRHAGHGVGFAGRTNLCRWPCSVPNFHSFGTDEH